MGLTTLLKRSHATTGVAAPANGLANKAGEPPVNDIDGKVRV